MKVSYENITLDDIPTSLRKGNTEEEIVYNFKLEMGYIQEGLISINKEPIVVYHGSNCEVTNPEVRVDKHYKDFGFGFYVTKSKSQAEKWAKRNRLNRVVSEYEFKRDSNLNFKVFKNISDDWLDFIAMCRFGKPHNFDIVEGPMADDKIFNYINDYVTGSITREAFMLLCKFDHPTHQIVLSTDRALKTIKFRRSYNV